jgi:sRNA-binding carbon storage regulator CsrA
MLAITRRNNQSITITTPTGEKLIFALVRIKGSNQAILGIEAPKEYIVRRSELPELPDGSEGQLSFIPAPEKADVDA